MLWLRASPEVRHHLRQPRTMYGEYGEKLMTIQRPDLGQSSCSALVLAQRTSTLNLNQRDPKWPASLFLALVGIR